MRNFTLLVLSIFLLTAGLKAQISSVDSVKLAEAQYQQQKDSIKLAKAIIKQQKDSVKLAKQMLSKINDSAKLSAKLVSQRQELLELETTLATQRITAKSDSDNAQAAADENRKLASNLAGDAQNRKIAKRAEKSANEAQRSAKRARKSAAKADDLQDDIQSLRSKISDGEGKLTRLRAVLVASEKLNSVK